MENRIRIEITENTEKVHKEGMNMQLLGTLILIGIVIDDKIILEHKVDNYPISRVDSGKMAMDSGKSYDTIKRNLVAGKYDKK